MKNTLEAVEHLRRVAEALERKGGEHANRAAYIRGVAERAMVEVSQVVGALAMGEQIARSIRYSPLMFRCTVDAPNQHGFYKAAVIAADAFRMATHGLPYGPAPAPASPKEPPAPARPPWMWPNFNADSMVGGS